MAYDPTILVSEIGSTGLKRQGGVIYEEFLHELRGANWDRAIIEMSNQDPVIGAILFTIEMLISQVKWRIEPASADTEDVAVAEFINGAMFDDMSQSWSDTLSEIISFLPWGWAFLEVVYKHRNGQSEDPTQRSKFDDGRIGWRKWSIRAQDTRWEWVFDESGGVQALVQQAPPNYRVVTIPIDKGLLFRTTAAKGTPEGKSILRTAYRPWYFKKNIENIEAIGAERDLAGLPMATVPPEIMAADASAEQKAIFTAVKKIVVNIRRDEQEGVVFPAAYDEDGNLMYDLKLLSSGGSRQFDTGKIVERYSAQIAMSVLATFIVTGVQQHGSFALHSSQTNLFTVAIGAYLDKIGDVINAHAIPKLLKLNGIDLARLPKLGHGDIETIDLTELGNYIQKLSFAGMPLFPDPELEKFLRQQAGLPLAQE